jgi:DNA repair and recombination protein RAD52
MPAKKEAPAAEPTPTPEEAEAAAADPLPADEAEVRAEEFNAGIGQPVGNSAWPDDIIEELRKPLDPNRVRSRQGRGRGKFEYLAGHDVKRRASEIFGFGNWGHHVKALEEIAAVEVQNNDGKDGWHVGYRCHVSIWIRHSGGVFSTDGIGYGDGVEYSAAARITACELAMKEAETDALKRAFTDLGDQFGLILYAKGDEKAKINRDRAADSSSHAVVRQESGGRANAPKNWTEALARFDARLGIGDGEAQAWLEELVEKRYAVPSLSDLTSGQRQEALTKFSAVVMALEEEEGDLAFVMDLRGLVRGKFAGFLDGVALDGPPWRYSSTEEDRPAKGEHIPVADPEEAPAAASESAS